MLNAVIFDLDGTLVDSEVLWLQVTREIVESFGKEFDDSWHAQIRGVGGESAMRKTKEQFDLPASVEELLVMNREKFQEKIKTGLPPKKPGADALMQLLLEAKIPFALATSGDRVMVEYVLNGHGWTPLFQAVVTVDDVVNAKPAPDIYLEAARRLGFMSETCVAFEDALNGIKSAKAAGMKVVGLADHQHLHELEEADRQVQSLADVLIDDLRKLI